MKQCLIDTPNKLRSFKFNFWKDGFLIWTIFLPFGLICWGIPFLEFFGLVSTNKSPEWFPLFAFIFLGIPSYLVGWIFIYSFMEGIYTKVTITDHWVSVRIPWVIIPIFPRYKIIDLEKVHGINLFASYGTRLAVYLYYYKNNKERHFYLPRFKNNPAYVEEMIAIQKRVETFTPPVDGLISPNTNHFNFQDSHVQQRKEKTKTRPFLVQRVAHLINAIILCSIYVISAWIANSIPPGGIKAIEIGFVIGFMTSEFGLLGIYPVVGQVLIWFFGRWGIDLVSGLFFQISPDKIYWDSPASINKLLSRFDIQPIHSTYADFLFWSILFFSITISLDVLIGYFGRQRIKRQMGID